MKSYSSEGIVLSKKNLGEADKILTIFSKSHGKVSFVAKGVRRPKSRKRGHVEIFNKIVFQAHHGNSLDVLSEVEIIDDFSSVKKNLKKVSLAYYFCEVINKIIQEKDINPQVYSILGDSLEELKVETRLKKLRYKFIHRLLSVLGYWPEEDVNYDYDKILEDILERQLSTVRVGKSMLE